MRASKQFELLNLPNELIALIIDHVDDQRTLRDLARTCRRIQDIAEKKLYRQILIRSGRKAKAIDGAIKASPRHGKALEFLNIPCARNEPQDYKALSSIFKSASGLKEIMFESPACNSNHSSEFEKSSDWLHMAGCLFSAFNRTSLVNTRPDLNGPPPLRRLQKLTLHLNGIASPYWTLDFLSICIFQHPTLQELKISCVNILDDIVQDIPDRLKYCTPLRKLILEECNICDYGLKALLSLPKALEMLHLGENCHNIGHFSEPIPRGSNNLFQRRPDHVVEALEQQKHSLKSLSYATGRRHDRWWPDTLISNVGTSFIVNGGFSDFLMLEEVTLVGYSPSFERCLMSSTPPRNLKRLAVKAERLCVHGRGSYETRHDETTDIALVPFLRAPSACIPESLKELNITYTNRGFSISQVKDFVEERSFVRDVAKVASKMGVSLRFFATCDEGPQWYYPPYLYGEQEPEEELVFDGKLLEAGDLKGMP